MNNLVWENYQETNRYFFLFDIILLRVIILDMVSAIFLE
jgi:hypothetical protein